MRVIGVTGGVGAGKSTVLAYLEEKYGAEVIQADAVGHEVMEPGKRAYREILEEFGQKVLKADKKIDRRILGALVFQDSRQLHKLNGIVHPAVKHEILKKIGTAGESGKAYVIVEAALFFEENYNAFCDETWYIYTDEKKRRKRLKESRGYTDERIDQVMANQRKHEEFLSRCQLVIDNNGTGEETRRQIDKRMKNL